MSSKCDFRFDPYERYGDPDWDRDDFFRDIDEKLTLWEKVTVPETAVQVDSDTGAWRVTTGDSRFKGSVYSRPDGWSLVGRGSAFGGEIAMAKGEWSVRAPDLEIQGGPHEVVRDIRGRFGRGQLAFGSDKCDWRFEAGTRELFALAEQAARRLEVEARGRQFNGRFVCSDKCDWRMRGTDLWRQIEVLTRGPEMEMTLEAPSVSSKVLAEERDWRVITSAGAEARVRSPEIDTQLSANKSDRMLRIRVSIPDGPAFRLHAVGSDKCDFRFDRLEFARDGVDFRVIDMENPETIKGR